MKETGHKSVPLATACAIVAVVALLPFARGFLTGGCFYHRDLARQVLPMRSFVAEGVARGEGRFWNPYVHEGEPVSLPIGYPGDLLEGLWPDFHGVSVLLALHVPLATVGFLLLGRRGLRLSLTASGGAALVYGLGGFCLSSLNLYFPLHAEAWAPLAILGLLKAAEGGRCWTLAAIPVAIAISTGGVEYVLQALLIAVVLVATRGEPRRWVRIGAAALLGVGLAGVPIGLALGLVADSARAQGVPTEMALGFALHPVAFGQALVAGLFHATADPMNRAWGGQFFPSGPYFLSLYLGAAALCVAAVGLRHGPARHWQIAALAGAAACLCLGARVGLDLVLDALPALRMLRYPVKAFFTVHLSVALLAAVGLESLQAGERRPWRLLAGCSLGLGAALGCAPLLPAATPGLFNAFLSWFFSPVVPWARRIDQGELILSDAAAGGALALVVGLLAVAVLAGKLRAPVAAVAVAGLLAADLLRAGTGVNPTVAPSFLQLSPDMTSLAGELKRQGGRIFACEPERTVAFVSERLGRVGRHDPWSTAVHLESLATHDTVRLGLPSAFSPDFTALSPPERTFPRTPRSCSAQVASSVEDLRLAGVKHLLSLDPLSGSDFEPVAEVRPRRIEPLTVHVYRLRGALPLWFVATRVRTARDREAAVAGGAEPGFRANGGVVVEAALPEVESAVGRVLDLRERPGRIELEVEADRATAVVVREGYARGWAARVGDAEAAVLRADGRHLAVPIPAGRHRVVLDYRPPGLTAGLAVSGLAAIAIALLAVAGRPKRAAEAAEAPLV